MQNHQDFRGLPPIIPGASGGGGLGNFQNNPPSSSGSSSSVNTHHSNHNEDLNSAIQYQQQQQLSAAQVASGKSGRPGPADVSRLSHPELVQRVRKLEADLLKLATDHNHMIREANHRIQVRIK